MTVLQSSIAAASGSAAPTGYQIERSLRFNSADSAVLSRTFTSGGSKTTWTYSTWIKRSALYAGGDLGIFATMPSPQQNRLHFMSGDKIIFLAYNGGGFVFQVQTTQVFRDLGAWFHLVAVVDSTNATASERIRLYVNGVRITNLDIATYPSQNADCLYNGPTLHEIGGYGGGNFFNGYFAEANFVDGQALDPSYFGEFNSATGVWSPLAYTGSYGVTGFYLPYNDNSTALNLGRNRETLTSDPYFPVTTLLLNGNQPSGVTDTNNNVFKDSSANNFTITRNGNTTQGTFSPFSQTGWSAYFNGSQTSPSLSFPSNAAYSLGSTADFTVEMFVNFTNGIGSEVSLVERFDGTSGPGWIFGKSSGDKFWVGFGGSTYPCNTSLVANRWYHLCWMRTGGNSYLFVDGVLDRAAITTANFTDGSSPLSLGERDGIQTFPLTGYMSNVRIVKGTAVYSTSGFTVPTTALTSVTNTSLLTCQSNRFVDNSVTAAVATVGAASFVQAFSPFAPTAAYDTAVVGGSGYFDGSGDYLTFTDSANDLDLGGLVASFEAWVYPTSTANYQHLLYKSGGALSWSASNGIEYAVAFDVNKFYFVYNVSGAATFVNGTSGKAPNQWYHIAVATDASNNIALFVNGVREGTATNAITKPTTRTTINVGANPGGTETIYGYICGQRFIKGSGAYDPTQTTITIPTSAPTAVTNTKLLLNYTNSGIYDSTAKNALETVGNAQVSTTQKKWGTTSMYFDGTGDALKAPYTPNMDFGTGDFTIECWVYVTNTSPGYSQTVLARHGSAGGTIWIVQILNGGTSRIVLGGSVVCAGTTVAANTWTHLAFTRSGTSLKAFNNGVLISTATDSTSLSGTQILTVGAQADVADPFIGYIDDVRITKGYARYTGNFSVPTAPFAYNQADINVKQWTPTNFSVTAGVGNDSLVDTPTNYGTDTGAGGEVRGNYCTFNPLSNGGVDLSNGNLSVSNGAAHEAVRSTFYFPSTGKWYAELTHESFLNSTNVFSFGVDYSTGPTPANWNDANKIYVGINSSAYFLKDGTTETSLASGSFGGSTLQIAYDADTQKLWLGKNNVWIDSSNGSTGNPSAGTNPTRTGITGGTPAANIYQNTGSANFGQRPFVYTAPSGFKALCTQNLPTPAIGATSSTLASKNFDVVLYTGDGNATKTVSGLSFQTDILWSKSRSQAYSHLVYDVLRTFATLKAMTTNATTAEGSFNDNSTSGYVNAVSPTGFSVTKGSTGEYTNQSGVTYSVWNWKAGGAGVSNTAGTIASTVSANPAAGISVVTWTGNGNNSDQTLGTGLSTALDFIITKPRDSGAGTDSWLVYTSAISLGQNEALILNSTGGKQTGLAQGTPNRGATSGLLKLYAGTEPGLNNQNLNKNGIRYVAYCFHQVAGFSKFGSYTGNGSTDGPFVYCGFRPRYVMIKRTDTTSNWSVYDTARDTYNDGTALLLYPNLSNAETSIARDIDILSNGFKCRSTDTDTNASGGTYVFMAFAEAPINFARAR